MMCESDALGGAEMVVLRLAQALKARSYDVVGVGPDEVTQPDRGTNGWLRAQFAQQGLEWLTYRKQGAVDLSCVRQLAEIMKQVKPSVVHSHEFAMAIYGTAAARRARVPHVISMHGNMKMMNRWTRRMALRWAFGHSRATVAVSEQTRDDLVRRLRLAPERITVIRNGVPDAAGNRDTGRRALGVTHQELLILAVGSLIPRKAHLVLLQALTAMEHTPPWRLAIAGTGVEGPRLAAYAREHGLEQRVHLLGQRNDIPDLLAAADVFAMPSLWEGLPLALLEAMLAGKVIVASAVSGIPEAVMDGRQGLLVRPGDVAALAAALKRVLEDAHLREALGRAARERAAREFSMDAMTDAHEQAYFGGV